MSLPYFDKAQVRAALPFDAAIAGMERALRGGVDPENDSPRLFSPAPGGEFLLMPTSATPRSGLKVVTIAPDNPAKGLEKIQGLYMLFDSDSLSPIALMDGTELTAVRTPAATLTAVKHLTAADPDFPAAPKVLVFGAGIQAVNHILAARSVYPDATFSVVGRTPSRVDDLIETLAAQDVDVSRARAEDAARHDIILCVTSSSTPVFDGSLPPDHAVIASVGQHGLEAREVDATLVLRADVFVEGRESSWRESGNLAQVRSESEWREIAPANIRELATGEFARELGRPALYTGVGMSWEDLALATLVYDSASA